MIPPAPAFVGLPDLLGAAVAVAAMSKLAPTAAMAIEIQSFLSMWSPFDKHQPSTGRSGCRTPSSFTTVLHVL